jgi:D-glutamate cyclase
VDHLLALDPGGRGIAAFFTPGAARAAAHALRGARRVLITTGFAVAADAPETDGPPGAAVLGHALAQLGARVRYVTDPVNVPILESALAVLGERADVLVYPEGNGVAPALLRREHPTHMVAIERPGRCREGDYLNARGVSVAAWNRPIDELFVRCRDGLTAGRAQGVRGLGRGASRAAHSASGIGLYASHIGLRTSSKGHHAVGMGRHASVAGRRASRVVTIGVGDGGNEIGMGNVRARLRRLGPLMSRIAAIVETDHLVVAGVSNWGAYGIVAALSEVAGHTFLHAPEEERRLIEACVGAGAIDGLSRRREATVDGLGLDVHMAFVRLLRVVAASGRVLGMIEAAARPSPQSILRRKASEP